MQRRPEVVMVSDIVDPKFILRPLDTASLIFIQMVDSIRAAGGPTNAPSVRRTEGERRKLGLWEIIDGYWRVSACRIAGIQMIVVVVCEDVITDEQLLAEQVITNAIRYDTAPTQYAQHIQRIKKVRPDLSYSEIASLCHQSRPWVYRQLKLLNLTDEIRFMVDQGVIGLSNACLLGTLLPEHQKQHLEEALRYDTSAFRQHINIFRRRVKHIVAHKLSPWTGPRPKRRAAYTIAKELKSFKYGSRLRAATGGRTWREGYEAALQYVLGTDKLSKG